MIGETELFTEYTACRICPRNCGVNRLEGQKGRCGQSGIIRAGRAGLHMWEEPCLSGTEGSGTVFFTGCALGCCFCQNQAIAEDMDGVDITKERLAEIFLELQDKKANNINLVTAGHFLPHVIWALERAKKHGLTIPVVWNSSGYEKADSIRRLEGLVDIYLPDFKYMYSETAAAYSNAADYPAVSMACLAEMVRQVRDAGGSAFDERGIMQRGVIVRHLLLPGHVREAKEIVSFLVQTYGDEIFVSLMSQYTPMPQMSEDKLLGRKVTKREYEKLIGHALEIGLENGFTQEGEAAQSSFIPAFDGEGVIR